MEKTRIIEALGSADALGAQLDEVTDVANQIQLVQRFRIVKNCEVSTLFGKTTEIENMKSETVYNTFDDTLVGV